MLFNSAFYNCMDKRANKSRKVVDLAFDIKFGKQPANGLHHFFDITAIISFSCCILLCALILELYSL